MTGIEAELRTIAPPVEDGEIPGTPEGVPVVAPVDAPGVAAALQASGRHGSRVLVWGGGTHQGLGGRVDADLVLSTARLGAVLDHRPEDLTIVVEAGVTIGDLEARLADHRQTAVLAEDPGPATIGGSVAAAVSARRRLRYGPTRERVIEATLVTGDGRIVRGGGRVVKNATGYDLPRLATGSFGRLGVLVSVCLKLWPVPPATATVDVADPERALAETYRPLAVLEVDGSARVYLAGLPAEVEEQAARLGGHAESGLHWPGRLPGTVRLIVRVPPTDTRAAIERVPSGWQYQAAFGVGEVEMSGPAAGGALIDLRAWAESRGGALVLAGAPDEVYGWFDPWGAPPPTLAIQRRLVASFDPAGTVNPGRLPGGL